jgi:predicted TIM-barrel fold metal-dependent hydrolase
VSAVASSDRVRQEEISTLLVDADVHEQLGNVRELLPYLDPIWHRYISEEGYSWIGRHSSIEHFPYTSPQVGSRREWLNAEGKRHSDFETAQRHLFEDEEVTHAILCGAFRPGCMRTDYEFAVALASAYNDWQIEHWLNRDHRLRGSVHIVPDLPEDAAREIDRVAKHPQIVQVFLPLVTDRQYGDPRYRPIFEAAVRNGLVVSLHHGSSTETVLGYPRYYIEWHTLAAPQAGAAQLCSLIFNGVFDALPALRVVLLETGVAWVPWFMGRADQQLREVYANVPWVKRLPSEHMRSNVRVATQPMTELTAREFVELVKSKDLQHAFVFATDYPHYDADSARSVLAGLPDDLNRRVRYQNAIDFYPRLQSLAP